MGAFSEFDQAQKRLSAARTAFNTASARIRPFREQSDEALKKVLKEFAEAGLFPNIDTNQHERLSSTMRLSLKIIFGSGVTILAC